MIVVLLTNLSYEQRKEKVAKRKENQQHKHHFKKLWTIKVNRAANLNDYTKADEGIVQIYER